MSLPQKAEVNTLASSDPVTFLSRQIATWFVRSQNYYLDVDRLNTSLPQTHLHKICVQRITQRFPELVVTNEDLKEVFQRVIRLQTH